MKKLIRVLLLLVPIFGFFTQGSLAQSDAHAQISAQIVTPASAEQNESMSFGILQPEIIENSINNPSEKHSVKNDFTANSIKPAIFKIYGEKNGLFSVTLPKKPCLLHHPEKVNTIMVANWATSSDIGCGAIQLLDGQAIVSIEATLMAASNDISQGGIYQGSYEITFDYN